MRDRYAGCLIGQCLGDAMGFPVEGCDASTCAAYVESILGGADPARFSKAGLGWGQYTDDSQLAREMLQSYVARGVFDPADYAARIAAIFAEGRIVGRGRATSEAAGRLQAGVAWEDAGAPAPAAGNGSAMRAAPVALMFPGSPEALVVAADVQSRITHADPRCRAGAVAVAAATARCLRGASAEPAAFVGEVARMAASIDGPTGRALERVADLVALPLTEALPVIATLGLDPAQGSPWPGISPFVTASVGWSLYAFLRSPDDYLAVIETAVAVGGDVDTTAAMAGAMCGARVGLAGIYEPFRRLVHDQGTWGHDELVDLAGRAHRLAAASAAE